MGIGSWFRRNGFYSTVVRLREELVICCTFRAPSRWFGRMVQPATQAARQARHYRRTRSTERHILVPAPSHFLRNQVLTDLPRLNRRIKLLQRTSHELKLNTSNSQTHYTRGNITKCHQSAHRCPRISPSASAHQRTTTALRRPQTRCPRRPTRTRST